MARTREKICKACGDNVSGLSKAKKKWHGDGDCLIKSAGDLAPGEAGGPHQVAGEAGGPHQVAGEAGGPPQVAGEAGGRGAAGAARGLPQPRRGGAGAARGVPQPRRGGAGAARGVPQPRRGGAGAAQGVPPVDAADLPPVDAADLPPVDAADLPQPVVGEARRDLQPAVGEARRRGRNGGRRQRHAGAQPVPQD